MRRLVAFLACLPLAFALVAACATGFVSNVPGDGGTTDDGGSACPQFDLKTDPLHCGSCTNACIAGQLCSAGTCKSSCDSPTTKCTIDGGPLCVTLGSDPNNCGQCSKKCGAPDAGALAQGTGNLDAGLPPTSGYDAGTGWVLGTPGCTSGSCNASCPAGTTDCGNGVCFDMQNHHDHCGSCGTACDPNDWCTSGHCCAPGQLYCGGACTDVTNSATNCGKCGTVCSGGTPYCANGTCTAGCNPAGTRQPFNSVVSSTVTGCYSAGNPCVQDTVVFGPANGRNFQALNQEFVCGGTTACIGHVSIGTYQSAGNCQGTWDVYCNSTKLGSINTLGKACAGTAMTNGCGITFTPTSCTTLRFVATAGSGVQNCCGGVAPDSVIVAVSAW